MGAWNVHDLVRVNIMTYEELIVLHFKLFDKMIEIKK